MIRNTDSKRKWDFIQPNLANKDKNTEFCKGNQGNVHLYFMINTSVSKIIITNKNRPVSLKNIS